MALVQPALCSAACIVLLAQPVLAESQEIDVSDRLTSVGEWTMSAPNNKAQPDCVEIWTVRPDGSMTIKSNQERVEKRWRVGKSDGHLALFTTRVSSSGGLDCVGQDMAPFDDPDAKEDEPLWLLEFKSPQDFLLCNPAFVDDPGGGKPAGWFGDNCWGKLVPQQ
jgi:hypothetical protein